MKPGDIVVCTSNGEGWRYGYVVASSGHRSKRTTEEAEGVLRSQVEAEGDTVAGFRAFQWFSHRKDWFETCGCDEREMWCEDGNGSAFRIVLCVQVATTDGAP